jgi:ribosome maturation factor RimP
MSTTDAVEQIVAPLLSELGIELVDVESERGHLKVTIDREPRLDLGAISEATSAISHALDEADPVPGGRYELEVTSPGVERRLRRPEHFSRVVGTEIAVKLRAGTAPAGERRFEGRLTSVDEAGIVMAVASGQESPRHVSFGDLESAHTVFDWRAALAEAPSPPPRHDRRDARPSAADRSRAAAARRAQSPTGQSSAGAGPDAAEATRRAQSPTGQSSAGGRPDAAEATHRASTQPGHTVATQTDDDRHLTETP